MTNHWTLWSHYNALTNTHDGYSILGDPGADSGDEGKSKRARRAPGDNVLPDQFQRSPPFWRLIGARKLVFFWHQSEARTAATVGTGLVIHCPQGLFSPFFTFLRANFSARLDFPASPLSAPGSPRMHHCQISKKWFTWHFISIIAKNKSHAHHKARLHTVKVYQTRPS